MRHPFAKRSEIEDPSINLTPLIDVVFVILITFILIAPFLQIDQVALAPGPGNKSAHEARESSPVTLHVFEDNRLTFNHQEIALEDLPEILKKAKQNFPSATPQLFQDQKAQFGTYQAVKNAVELAGFEQLDIILKPG